MKETKRKNGGRWGGAKNVKEGGEDRSGSTASLLRITLFFFFLNEHVSLSVHEHSPIKGRK